MLKVFRIASLCLVAGGLFAGCASTPTGEPFSTLIKPPSAQGLLYLYRPGEHYGMALTFKVLIDGKEKGDIGNAAYMVIPLEPGKHSIEVKGFGYKDEPSSVEAAAGDTAFMKVVTKKGFGGFSATLTLEQANQSVATQGLAGLKRELERFVDQQI